MRTKFRLCHYRCRDELSPVISGIRHIEARFCADTSNFWAPLSGYQYRPRRPRTKRLLTPPTSKPSLLRMLLHNHLSIFRLKSASSSLTSSFGREARQQQHKMLFEKSIFR